MDMKTKTIVTAMLLATAYVLLVNLMFLSGFGKDEMVKVGWYSEFGGNSTTTLYPLYVWLNFPYTVCFYFFTTLFFAKVKVHVNKWLGETAFVLWCVSLVPILVNTVYDLYMVSSFDGDEMYRSLENYWETEGKSDYPFMWLLLSSRVGNNRNWMNDLNYYGNWALWAAFLAFAIVFALLFKKDKVLGIAGATVMVVSILLNMFLLPCGYIAMRRFLLILAVVLFAMTAFAAIAPGLYRVNVNSTLNVRNAPGGAKIGSLSNGDLVQVTACEDDWAQVSLNDGRTGYVHEQYLEPFSTLAAPAGTSYSTVGLSELRHYTPFAILLFAVIAFIGLRTDTRSLFHAGCLLWGGAELFMFGAGSDSALVWFCDPSDVGWIFTIINFFVAIGILFFQYTIYREFTGSLFDGFWRKLLFGIFIIVGVILFLGIFNYNRYDSITPDSPETPFFNETWHFVLAFVAYMAVLLYLLRDCGIWMSLSFTVFAFGLGISFLGMLSTLILGALLWLGLAAFSGSGGSNGSRGNIIIEDYDGTYEAYEHGFGIYKDVTGSGKTWRKEDSQYIRIN